MNVYQIPRNSLAWLLCAQIAVILPHVGRLPIWVTVVSAACIVWRVMVYRGHWRFPGKWVCGLLVVAGFLGVPIGYRTILGLEPAIALLVVAYVLKLLEMHRQRDAYVVILLGYFVAMCQFLFQQSIPWTIYVLASVMMISAGLIGLNQTQTHTRPLWTLRKAGALTAQSLPLMLVLFVLFPRIPPLWTVPTQTQTARSGMSDEVSPGDIASLATSSELAFNVTFEGNPPPQSSLYWRGLTLGDFDGETWRQDRIMWRAAYRVDRDIPPWAEQVERRGRVFNYDVIMEPTQQNWMFTLTMPDLPTDTDIAMGPDYRWVRIEPVRSKFRYQVTSTLNFRTEPILANFWRYRMTRLPEEGNPRARALATELRSRVGSDADYVDEVMRYFYAGDFNYTLQPPLLGDNKVDDFLFETRRGFCEHFASSYAFLMRAANIPARLVVGYHGGEYNDIADYFSVYQYDAHAWVEVWLEGRGWVRVDPTTSVAPNRLEQGLQAAVEAEETFLLDSPFSLFARQNLILAEIRLQISALTYYWDTWVVGYTPEVQQDLLRDYLGDFDRKDLGILLLVSFFSVLAVIGFFVLLKRAHQPLPPVERAYLQFCRIMEKAGVVRQMGEAPDTFGLRAAESMPDLAEEIRTVTEAFVRLNYATPAADDEARLKRTVRHLRLRALG